MQQQIKVDRVLEIEGVTFRGFQGEVDYPVMVTILKITDEFDQINEVTTLEDIQRSYSHLTNCDPYEDMLFAEADGEPIAYCRVFWRQQPDKNRIYWQFGTLVPEWRRKGVGRAMVRWGERRLRKIAYKHPRDGERYLQIFGADTQVGTEELFRSEGYQPIRYEVEMARTLKATYPRCLCLQDSRFVPYWMSTFGLSGMPMWRRSGTIGVMFLQPRRATRIGSNGVASTRSSGRSHGTAIKWPGWCSTSSTSKRTKNLTGAFRLYESMGFEEVKRWTDHRKNFDRGLLWTNYRKNLE